MDFKIKKLEIIFFLMAILCILIGMSCVSAVDLNGADVSIGDINSIDDTLEGIELNDFEELQNDVANLNSGDVYYFTRDYNFEFNDSDSYGTDISDTLIVYNCTFENESPDATDNFADNSCDVLRDSINSEYIFNTSNFKELKYDLENLKDNAVYNLDKDYYVMTDTGYYTFIRANNVTINGNGRTIYGQDPLQTLFTVYGNNVKINNLNFEFSNDNFLSESFIDWYGDNGALTDCVFTGAGSDSFGGALTWGGNNGIIDSCIFNDNIGDNGGAIFVSGTNNTISNSFFIDCISITDSGAIYYRAANGPGALNISNCVFESTTDEFLRSIWIDDNDSDVTVDEKVVPKTFDVLYEEISNLKENEVYDIYRNYDFNTNMNFNTKNITIRGNGHTVYVNRALNSSLITVTSADVKIDGLNINNTLCQLGSSLITWSGNNGILKNSILSGNNAQIGGAVTWEGKSGVIDNCIFINNIATYVGGAIYADYSENLLIRNCVFINSSSLIAGEAVFVDRKSRYTFFQNDLFTNEIPYISGKQLNISIDYLMHEYDCLIYEYNSALSLINSNIVPMKFYSYNINLIPMIFSSIVVGGVQSIDNGVSYYSQYIEDTGDFVFTVSKDYNKGIVYAKDYVFQNISLSNLDDLFDKLLHDNYTNQVTIIVNKNISSQSDYDNLRKVKYEDCVSLITRLIFDADIAKCKNVTDVTKALNVQFTKKLTISNDDSWNVRKMGFNVINIDGHGSTIKGSFKDSDEDKWAVVKENDVFSASNIVITGFNTAIENFGGYCIFNNVTFLKNKMDYWIERDWGAAIISTGVVLCTNCTFEKNYAKNGGAIFNQGLLVIQNCTFIDNDAYGKGDNICIGDGGLVMVDGQNVTNNTDIVYFAKSMSASELDLWIIVSMGASLFAGIAVGLVTANPAVSIVAGAGLGAFIGGIAAPIIISKNYDVNFNRLEILFLIPFSSAAGAFGGFDGVVYYEIAVGICA